MPPDPKQQTAMQPDPKSDAGKAPPAPEPRFVTCWKVSFWGKTAPVPGKGPGTTMLTATPPTLGEFYAIVLDRKDRLVRIAHYAPAKSVGGGVEGLDRPPTATIALDQSTCCLWEGAPVAKKGAAAA